MGDFLLSEKYRLELHWKYTKYEVDGVCNFLGAYFSGPALSFAEKINDNDNIMLDFYKQYVIITRNVYIAKLSWGEVEYKDNIIYLNDAIMFHDTELNKVPKLANNDFLVIDTKDHEVQTHAFHMVYPTYVVNGASELYKFDRG